mgnify:FL=1
MENALVTTHLRSKRNDGIARVGCIEWAYISDLSALWKVRYYGSKGEIKANAFEESLLLESFVDEVVLCGIERSLHHSSLQKLVQEIVLLLLKLRSY